MVSILQFCKGRALLRQYLQEIGYTDTIIDVRSNRLIVFSHAVHKGRYVTFLKCHFLKIKPRLVSIGLVRKLNRAIFRKFHFYMHQIHFFA